MSLLSSVHPDLMGSGVSSMDTEISDEIPSPYVYILGDFIAIFSQNSKFGKDLTCLCNRYSLCITDKCYYQMIPSHTLVWHMEAHRGLITV